MKCKNKIMSVKSQLNEVILNKTETKETECVVMNNFQRFSEWIKCICIVTFDLNLGQALEFVYPPEFAPNEKEISNICYMAFPDSNSGCMGDTKFHIRSRIVPKKVPISSSLSSSLYTYNNECISSLRSDKSHYWGFVYFRQKRDTNLPRGYFQKSFIIITYLPFFNLFYELLSQLAPKYFNEGNIILKNACRQINLEWPALQAGVSLDLKLFEFNYQIVLPKASSRRMIQFTDSKTNNLNTNDNRNINAIPTKIIASVSDLDIFTSLEFVIENLYTLWELVLTAEPIVVVGTSPADSSLMVQTLVALIAPLEYCAEARPYFTIHDSEFKEFTREHGTSIPSVILGVTNPFFVKLLKNWPHMLRLVDNQMNMQQQLLQKGLGNINSTISLGSSSSTKTNNSPQANFGINITDGTGPGLCTKYKPFLKKDKTLIKKVELGIKTKRPPHVQTALLRRHLLELTQSFMIPLERYVASLMPLQKDISPFKSAPNANTFKLDDFLATLELSGPHLTSPLKGDWKGLYKRFFNSANFRGWYKSRHRELQLTLQDLQLQALSEANLEEWAQDKQEVEIIDMILKLKQKMKLYTDKSVVPGCSNNEAAKDHINMQIKSLKEMLPSDLRDVVNI